ncbi:MAG: SagB/ThcOx family dehydrogenase [Candidatus Nitrosocosmicus sp.]
MNKDTLHSFEYHERTKHSEISIMTSQHYLDWDNRPFPFKVYPNLQPIQLPSNFPIPSMNATLAISTVNPQNNLQKNNNNYNHHVNSTLNEKENKDGIKSEKTITLTELSEVLFFSAGITRTINYNDNIFYMRAASATGALYPIEIYVVCKDISSDLKSGIYHFNPALFSLVPLRKGDYRSLLSSITAGGGGGGEDSKDILNSPITIIFTSFAWRNAWKYKDRSYRHWFWDAGVIAANMLGISASLNATAKVHLGFIDDKVNQLLALEMEKEATIAMISIDKDPNHNFENKINNTIIEKSINQDNLKSMPLSQNEEKFPLIWKTYSTSKLFTNSEVKEWINSGFKVNKLSSLDKNSFAVSQNKIVKKIQNTSSKYQLSAMPSLGETILKRGSSRKFARSPISFSTLSSILFNSTRGIPMDFKKDKETLVDIYLIANDVKDIDPGGYFYNRNQNSIELIKEKISRRFSGYLCLGQPLFSDASAVLFLMSNLNKVIEILGNRGYRAAQFESGIIAGKIYLSSYANEIGASGSTFYDDAVTEFFSPHSENKNTMIAVGIGNPAYKSRSGKILPIRLSKEQILEKLNI